MWKVIRDLLTRAGDALGVEVPELPGVGAVGDTVTGAAEEISGQAGQAASDLSGTAADAVSGIRDAVAGAADQAADTAADVTSQPGR